jgi:glycosyltransferase involved in cell wall biosynthesis
MFGKLWHKIGQNLVERRIYPYIEQFIATSPYDWFACPSKYSRRTLIEAGADEARISIIPHGIDLQLFNPNVDGKSLRSKFGLEKCKLFGFTGRLGVRGIGQSKNLVMLIEAVKYVVKEIPNAKLVLGGSGFHEILPFIRRFGVEKHVVYTGKRRFEEVPNFIAMCDVVVCPATADGYCFLLAEASACGKPVVATNAGAHPERVIHGITGFLTDLTPEALAEAVIKVLTDGGLAKKLGEKGVEFSRKFGREKSLTMHLEMYKKIMN